MSLLRALALAALAAFASPVRAEPPVVVFAAASLKNALDAAGADWAATSGETATISYAASSALAKQIEQGAPADLFISASTDWMDYLDAKSLIDKTTRRDLLGNTPIIVAPRATAPIEIADLPAALAGGKLAMALVDSVPAGVYGKAALTSLGLWDRLAPQVAQAENVRAALALVSRREAPFGIVYATDAAAEPTLHAVATFPADSHDPITYPVARTAASTNPAAAAFLDYLSSPAAAVRFTAEGFSLK